MEINKVDDTGQSQMSEEINLRRKSGHACIYYPQENCSVPNLKFKICQSCPRACQFIRKNVVKSVFDHVKSLAISLLSHMGVRVSSGGEGQGTGSGGGSGAGSGGAGGGGGGGAGGGGS